MLAFYEFIWNLFSSQMFLVVGVSAGVPLTIILIVIFARKKNHDERGWKIIGKASIASFSYFMVMANVIAKITGNDFFAAKLFIGKLNYLFYANTIQWLYDTMILVEIISILVIKKIE